MRNLSYRLQKLQKTALLFFVLFITTHTKAQIRSGYEYKNNCLKTEFTSFGIDSTCETVAWFIDSATTPVSKLSHFTHSFPKAGTYKVCLSVYNFCTRYDTMYCKSIKVVDCNSCDSIETKLKITKDSSVCGKYQFDAYPKNSNTLKVTYSWTFGDGNKSDNDDPLYTYSKNGTYRPCVTITAVKNGKSCSKTLCETLEVKCHTTNSKCQWKEKNMYIEHQCNTWVFNAPEYEDSCMSYKWTINGKSYNNRKVTVTFEKKDSFDVCLELKSLCWNCDTLICTTINNDCLPNTKKCTWENVGIGHSVNKDICGKVIFEANYIRDTCVKTEYYFDGKWYAGRIFDHRFTSNGRYKYGFRYKNTCTGCDTTIYQWVEIGCFQDGSRKCDWSRMEIGYHNLGDKTEENCRKYLFQANGLDDSCMIYKMKIVHDNTNIYLESGKSHSYTFENDGYYNVCFWAKNECLNCDTWVCKTVYIKCGTASNKNFLKNKIAPSPNPVKNVLTLHNDEPLEIEIRNTFGQLIVSQYVNKNAQIDMRDLPQQTYVLLAKDSEGYVFTHRFIKE